MLRWYMKNRAVLGTSMAMHMTLDSPDSLTFELSSSLLSNSGAEWGALPNPGFRVS